RYFNIHDVAHRDIKVPYEKLHNGEVVSKIMKDILEHAEQKTGHKYLMEMRQGKLYIERQKDQVIIAKYQRRDNGFYSNAALLISEPNKSRSVVDMVNTIQIVGNDDKLKLTRADTAMQRKFGRLQKVVKLDQKETRSAQQVAQAELKELSKITEEANVTLLGDDNVRAGRLIDIEDQMTGIKGRYLIESVDHSVTSGIHTMQLGLGART
ncbi:hypothetical protein LGW20_09805, partial [Streptococcus mutans]|nr:hypothetical protein [Streptococcus mutans]